MDALAGAGIALVTFALASVLQIVRDHIANERIIGAEQRADARAQRDAQLGRVREAFVTVVLAGWGIQTAASELFMTSMTAEQTDAMLSEALKGVNEARARILLEEDCRDVFEEFEKIRKALPAMQLAQSDRRAGDPDGGKAFMREWQTIKDGVATVERLTVAHLERIARSAGGQR